MQILYASWALNQKIVMVLLDDDKEKKKKKKKPLTALKWLISYYPFVVVVA